MIHERDYLILSAAYGTPNPHSHLALHLLFAGEGKLNCLIGGENVCCGGVCIDSGVEHTASAAGHGDVLAVLVETTSVLAGQIRNEFLKGEGLRRGFCVLPEDFTAKVRRAYRSRETDALETLIRTLDGRCPKPCGIEDERILNALKYIRDQKQIDGAIYGDLSRITCLSQSRLSHLFKEQAGVSLAAYLTWAKLEKACRLIQAGETMTRAAADAGFSSSSHLSSTFRRMFGISCSDFLHSL